MHTHRDPMKLGDVTIHPGERKTVMLAVPRLYDWSPMHMPVHVLHGKHPGPTLCVTAAIHGDEINGVEIVRRLLERPMIKKLKGTLIAVPIVNVYGFLAQNRYSMDRRDLNRSFPGSESGSLASRLAAMITSELVDKADYFIDLHTGSQHRSNLPQIRANLDAPEVMEVATAFDAPVIMHAKDREGSLRQITNKKGIPSLLYEAGECLRFDEFSIRIGVRGIHNVMRHLKMLPMGKRVLSTPATHGAITRSSYWVRPRHSGILRRYKSLGKKVKTGEVLAVVANPVGSEQYRIHSPHAGIIIGMANLPLVHEGAALFHIACFEELKQVEQDILDLQLPFEKEYIMGEFPPEDDLH